MTVRSLRERIQRKQLEFFVKGVNYKDKKLELVDLKIKREKLEIQLLEKKLLDN